jgi:hypothetical protein
LIGVIVLESNLSALRVWLDSGIGLRDTGMEGFLLIAFLTELGVLVAVFGRGGFRRFGVGSFVGAFATAGAIIAWQQVAPANFWTVHARYENEAIIVLQSLLE